MKFSSRIYNTLVFCILINVPVLAQKFDSFVGIRFGAVLPMGEFASHEYGYGGYALLGKSFGGEANVTQSQVVTYSTPYNAGNTYSWNASHGNPELCFPNRNCLALTWDFPCGIITPAM